jgi:hypothetical protein
MAILESKKATMDVSRRIERLQLAQAAIELMRQQRITVNSL